jgi:beta-exotoxin I transport system permease protein
MSVELGQDAGVVTTPVTPPSWQRSLAAVVRSGLHFERHAPLTWGGGLGATCALVAAMWPSVADSIGKAVESYPAGIKQAFGIQELNSVEQYVDVEMLSLVVPLALAFFAVRCATRAIVGAEERGHLDALLSLPLSRRVLVAGSFIVTGLVLAMILIVIWALTWIAGTLAGAHISATVLADGLANVWPLAMAFAGLAVLASGVLQSSPRSGPRCSNAGTSSDPASRQTAGDASRSDPALRSRRRRSGLERSTGATLCCLR